MSTDAGPERRKIADLSHEELVAKAHEMQGFALRKLGDWMALMAEMDRLANWPGPDTRETAEAMRAYASGVLRKIALDADAPAN